MHVLDLPFLFSTMDVRIAAFLQLQERFFFIFCSFKTPGKRCTLPFSSPGKLCRGELHLIYVTLYVARNTWKQFSACLPVLSGTRIVTSGSWERFSAACGIFTPFVRRISPPLFFFLFPPLSASWLTTDESLLTGRLRRIGRKTFRKS